MSYMLFEKMMKTSEYDIVEQFSYFFFNMQYDEAMQLVGIMKSKGMIDARKLEAMLYFEQNNFSKIRSIFKDENEMGTEEKEFYLVSLAELGLFDEFKVALLV